MANIASSKKDARRSAARAQRNRSVRSAVKTRITRFRRAAADGADGLDQLAVNAVAALDRAAAHGVLHRNNAARRKSRVAKRLNALAVPDEPVAEAAPEAKRKPRTKAKTAPAARRPARKP